MNRTKDPEKKLKLSTNKLKNNLRQLNVCAVRLPEKRGETGRHGRHQKC